MNLSSQLQKIAEEIGGQFLEYSYNQFVITVRLPGSRLQNVAAYRIKKKDVEMFELMSKICDLEHTQVDFKKMLEMSHELCYAKLIVFDDNLQAAASAHSDQVSLELIKEMLLEVATVADNLEHELTGKDVF